MDDLEPPHRIQKRALPESAPVIALAQQRRRAWCEAMRAVSQSTIDETERSCRDDEQGTLDI